MTRRLVLAVLLLAGCAAPRLATHWVDGATWPQGELRAVQRIELRGPDGTRALQAVVEGSPRELRVAVLDALGRRLLMLRSGPEGFAETREPQLPRTVDGREILADIVLAHWPEAELRALLPPALQLAQDGTRRTLSDRSGVLVTVDCAGGAWSGRCVIERARAGRVLVVDSLREPA